MIDRAPQTEIRCENSVALRGATLCEVSASRVVQWALSCLARNFETLSTLHNVPSVTSHVPPWLTYVRRSTAPLPGCQGNSSLRHWASLPLRPGTSLSQSNHARNSLVLGFAVTQLLGSLVSMGIEDGNRSYTINPLASHSLCALLRLAHLRDRQCLSPTHGKGRRHDNLLSPISPPSCVTQTAGI